MAVALATPSSRNRPRETVAMFRSALFTARPMGIAPQMSATVNKTAAAADTPIPRRRHLFLGTTASMAAPETARFAVETRSSGMLCSGDIGTLRDRGERHRPAVLRASMRAIAKHAAPEPEESSWQ